MFKVELNRKSLEGWRDGISRKFVRNFNRSQDETERDWRYEFNRQQASRGDGSWQSLDPVYERRKEREYPGRLILTRTDTMIPAYSIRQERTNQTVSVSLNFPSDEKLETIAKSHQGVIGQPTGVPARPFNLEKFIEIAVRNVNEAMKRASDE